jgi:hypothetical protein
LFRRCGREEPGDEVLTDPVSVPGPAAALAEGARPSLQRQHLCHYPATLRVIAAAAQVEELVSAPDGRNDSAGAYCFARRLDLHLLN